EQAGARRSSARSSRISAHAAAPRLTIVTAHPQARRIVRLKVSVRASPAKRLGLPDATDAAVVELLRRAPEHDIEIRRELAERRVRYGPIVDHQRLERLRIFDTRYDPVPRVRFVPFHERLRRHEPPARLAYCEVDMRSAKDAL